MANMEIQIIQVIIPSLLTVAGWLVAAWWTLEQVKITHEGNAKLQSEMLKETHRREIAMELINIYKSVTQSGNNFSQALFALSFSHGLDSDAINNGVKFNAKGLVAPVNKAYNELSREITRMDMWLKISEQHIPHLSSLKDAISEYQLLFTTNGAEGSVPKDWTDYQALLVWFQNGNEISHDKLDELSSVLYEAIHRIMSKIADGTARINKELCGV